MRASYSFKSKLRLKYSTEFVQRTAWTLPVQSWLYSLMQECPQAALCSRYNLELDFSRVLRDTWTVIFNINTHTEKKKKKTRIKTKKLQIPFQFSKGWYPFSRKYIQFLWSRRRKRMEKGLKGQRKEQGDLTWHTEQQVSNSHRRKACSHAVI